MKYGMTFEEIGAVLDLRPSHASAIFSHAMRKLECRPGAVEALAHLVHYTRARTRSQIGCGSVECRGDWLELFALDE